ncbi:helix-turn-helix transcriptional regulator [Cnuibacter sp. UC19_7]|uniref:helix-turn-helix transcriptional regulator n=1 Tax=Cnuibacter sp. UC19_7 TaxID=3350166 RepID=UPI00366CCF58
MRNVLRELREKNALTQVALGAALGVSRQTINALEAGRYDPSLPLAFRISAYFGEPIEDIFFPDVDDLPPNGGRP